MLFLRACGDGAEEEDRGSSSESTEALRFGPGRGTVEVNGRTVAVEAP